MEQATLRPVPLRPAGPVDPAEAAAHVLRALPDLGDDAGRALALIEIAGRTRDKAGEEMGVAGDALAQLLYEARKELRRSIFPLSASGWCERAERLLSDRIDGVLVPPGPARLDVHLRNCERCVEHERRLSQAREKLVRDFIVAHPESAGAGPAERPAAALRVVEPVAETTVASGPTRPAVGFAGVTPVPDDGGELPLPSFAGPGGQSEIVVEPTMRVADAGVPEPDELPEDPPLDADVPPAEPADATPSEHDADEPEPPVEQTEPSAVVEDLPDPADEVAPAVRQALRPVSLVWNSLIVLSVGLAVFAIIITILALTGLQRIF